MGGLLILVLKYSPFFSTETQADNGSMQARRQVYWLRMDIIHRLGRNAIFPPSNLEVSSPFQVSANTYCISKGLTGRSGMQVAGVQHQGLDLCRRTTPPGALLCFELRSGIAADNACLG